MLEIKEIKNKRDFKKFVKFPTELYKNCPNYVPSFELDEFNLTNPKKNASFDESEAIYFLALRDGKVVGRIAGIISHAFNQKNKAKYARFSRFDVENDVEAGHALLAAAEAWARDKGMDTIHGPLGFNDLEKEGLMVEGFDEMGTFLGSYNFAYYKDIIESYGYAPDCKWIEWRIHIPEKLDERVERVAKVVESRYGFHEKRFKNKNQLLNKYGKQFFKLLDECYKDLYGTIPFGEKLVEQTIGLFKLVIDTDFISLIFDKNDELAGFGIGFASLAKALQKSKGRYLPFGWIRLLSAIKNPTVIELGLIAVKPQYQKMGVTSLIIKNMLERIIARGNIPYADCGPQLETNTAAISSLDMFEREIVRRKTCYIKKLN
ncbi:MAG: GNAT family N-acetyltransferase [Clostridia bacterium]|nr:GNAT family N-acetyltransferase [Clostridia bacterium]